MSAPTKIILLGEGRVGKTCLIIRYCQNQFNENQKSTLNATYLEKDLELNGGEQIKLAIWDTAGQEIFHALAPVYYRDALGAILVYDITYKESFYKVEKWVQELKEFANKDIVIAIVGNKCDIRNQIQVDKNFVEEYCVKIGAKHFLTSAKANIGISEMFSDLGERINLKLLKNVKLGQHRRIKVEKQDTENKKKKKNDICC